MISSSMYTNIRQVTSKTDPMVGKQILNFAEHVNYIVALKVLIHTDFYGKINW